VPAELGIEGHGTDLAGPAKRKDHQLFAVGRPGELFLIFPVDDDFLAASRRSGLRAQGSEVQKLPLRGIPGSRFKVLRKEFYWNLLALAGHCNQT
jgi:hypothetical protein